MALDPYAQLPPIKVSPLTVSPGPLSDAQGTRVKFESAAPFTPIYVHHQLGNKAADYYQNRVKGKFVNLDKSIKESRALQLAKERLARREKDAQRRNARKLGASLPEVKGLWTLDQKDAQYARNVYETTRTEGLADGACSCPYIASGSDTWSSCSTSQPVPQQRRQT